jgi:hypothetical protein
MFEMSFHLPYFVCRASDITDHRRYTGGEPLRQRTDISFLNWESDLPREFLYEAQVSCAIAGLHQYNWVAYCFVDTYFDGSSDRRETVLEYLDNSDGIDGMTADPFTYGNSDANKPIWDPRRYFLRVYLQRTTPLVREWRLIIGKVEHSFRTYEQVCQSLFRHATGPGVEVGMRALSKSEVILPLLFRRLIMDY